MEEINIICENYLELELQKLLPRIAPDKNGNYHVVPGSILDLSNKCGEWYRSERLANAWKNYSKNKSTDYKCIDEVIELWLKNTLSIGTMDIVDYGCGNGVKGIHIYHKINGKFTNQMYFPVDLSSQLLEIAKNNALLENIPTSITECDLSLGPTKLLAREGSNSPRFHLFLGQTIGNFNHPEDLLLGIASTMHPNEYLLIEWFKQNKEYYEADENKELVEGYLERMGFSKENLFRDGKLDYFVKDSEEGWFKGCVHLNEDYTRNIINPFFPYRDAGVQSSLRKANITLPKGTIIVAMRSRKFKDEEVIELLEKATLKPVTFTQEDLGVSTKWYTSGNQRYALSKKTEEKKAEEALIEKQIKKEGFVKGISVGLSVASLIAAIGIYEKYTPSNYEEMREETREETREEKNYLGKELAWSPEEAFYLLSSKLTSTCDVSIDAQSKIISIKKGNYLPLDAKQKNPKDYAALLPIPVSISEPVSIRIPDVTGVSTSFSSPHVTLMLSYTKQSEFISLTIPCSQNIEQRRLIVDLLQTYIIKTSTNSQGYSE